MKTRAIILTKSAMRKNGKVGACTTGYDIDKNTIVRFVSDRKGSPLPYSVTDRFNLFDIVEFEQIDACPDGPQSENLFVSVDSLKVGDHYSKSPESLLRVISERRLESASFMSGTDYRMRSVTEYSHSLEVIQVSKMIITQKNGLSGKTGKVSFVFNGQNYSNFSITDLAYDIKGKDISEWYIGDAFIVVSIPSIPYERDDCYYKFIAAVYPINKIVNVTSGFSDEIAIPTTQYSFSASYSGFSPSFTILGIPEQKNKVPDFHHSCICVIKNILSRAPIVKPSPLVEDAVSTRTLGNIRERNLDTIIRFEYTLLTLAENGIIHFTDESWKFNVEEKELFRIAAEDVFSWMKNLFCLAGREFMVPTVLFSTGIDAITVSNHFLSSYTQKKDSISIINAKNADYYRVSSGKPITYNIEPNIPNEKKEALLFLLKNIFGYDQFNDGQLQIITSILNRRKTIGILPTGGGKSLCYQLAAVLQPGVSFSVCPLSSLSKDQKDNLDKLGFTRTNFITSDLTKAEKLKVLDEFAKGRYQIIWISPERLQTEEFREKLKKLHNICYAVIDEVHCLSEWGHDFRTSYLTLIPTIENYCPEATIVGLTATASQAVLKDLKIEFNIDRFGVKALQSLQRENLTLHVQNTDSKDKFLNELLENKEMVNKQSTGIVFTVFADKTDDEDDKPWKFHLLKKMRKMRPDLKMAKFHADMPAKKKEEVQKQFINGELNILSSTKAFGMGINKDDVRYTIHYDLPWSVESFYQEAGRAGRGKDLKSADCFIIYTPESPSARKETLRLFARDTTPAEIADFLEKHKKKNKLNDIGKIFLLWGNSHKGIEKDLKDIEKVIQKINKQKQQKMTDSQGRSFCTITEDKYLKRERLELALYRLKLVNVVTDWTVKWGSTTEFTCYLSDETSRENMQNNLIKYIRRYDPSFGTPGAKDSEKYQAVLDDASVLAGKQIYQALLEWSYDHILYSRRMMIYNIKEFCESYKDPVSFAKRIDDFLRITDANVVLDGIVDSPDNWEPWLEVFFETETEEGVVSKRFLRMDECEALHETLARYLESYRNVTGLNLIYCLSGALSGRYNIDIDHDIMTSVVSDLQEKYTKHCEEINERIYGFLDKYGSLMKESAVKDIADCLVEQRSQDAERYYNRFQNDYAMKVLLSSATKRMKSIIWRKIK